MGHLRPLLPEGIPSATAFRNAAILGATAAIAFAATNAFASFARNVIGGPGTYSSKRIFPGVRSTSAWTVGDASGGAAETNAGDALAYADAVVKSTKSFASSFASNRYVEFDFNGPRPAGVSVSSAQFNFRMASTAVGETSCFYFEVYRASTSALLATYGSTTTPVACNATTTQTTYSQAISQITTTAVLNDLRIRVYGKESGAAAIKIDLATVTGSTAYASYTMYEKIYRDQADAISATTGWAEATAGDTYNYTTVANLASTFSTSRYVKFTFEPGVPTGSVITSVHLKFYYRSNTAADTACWYFETYNGVTLLGTHGSSGTPQSCITGNTTYSTDDVTLSEATAVANANSLTVKAYLKESGLKKIQMDLVQVDLTYSLD
jgi:hypothetical protein